MGHFFRLFIIAVAVWLVVHLLRRALRPRPADERTPAVTATPRMLPCVVCGVHVPESEAVTHAGRVYCSREHALEERND